MSLDRTLVAAIKNNFAGKPSGQLQFIAESTDEGRWSPEAVAAAEEILRDRAEGRAQEPSGPTDSEPHTDTHTSSHPLTSIWFSGS